jgi:hypothetical protein
MASPRRQAGVLALHVEGYRAWLARHGYTTQTARNMLKDLGQVGLWLSVQGLDARDLDEEQLKQHLSDLRSAGRRRVAGPRGMVPLLKYLREAGVVPRAAGERVAGGVAAGDVPVVDGVGARFVRVDDAAL